MAVDLNTDAHSVKMRSEQRHSPHQARRAPRAISGRYPFWELYLVYNLLDLLGSLLAPTCSYLLV